jgi:type VI secretion system lysozyme-like protein
VAGLKLLRGARAPLFDRFGDEDGEGGDAFLAWHAARRGGAGLSLSALEQSIAIELDRLLNTRCAASLEQLAARPRSVIDYGLPDYSALHAADLKHRRQLGELVRGSIVAFEPRLRDVQVEVEPDPNSRQALEVVVSGRVVADDRLEPVHFKVSVRESA